MKPWHRDLMSGGGVLCLLYAAYLVSLVLALVVLGSGLIAIALYLAPVQTQKEPTDGNGPDSTTD